MTNATLKEMRQTFDNMVSEFSLDNLSSPILVERALTLEKTILNGKELDTFLYAKNA